MHCSFVVNEVIQHYTSQGSCVYIALLDATKAFDRIEYATLFKKLVAKGLCPLITRLLVNCYTQQRLRVRWNDSLSPEFSASNGVKQGGVLSPLLFTTYLDELLERLRNTRFGCHINAVYCGSFAYADTILLSPTLQGLQRQLDVCERYAHDHNIKFNPSKTKLIECGSPPQTAPPPISFMGSNISWVQKDSHLGTLVGNATMAERIEAGVRTFNSKVNMLKCHFKYLPTDIMYTLFKMHCMPLYSCVLWDLAHPSINHFLTAWRKAPAHPEQDTQ